MPDATDNILMTTSNSDPERGGLAFVEYVLRGKRYRAEFVGGYHLSKVLRIPDAEWKRKLGVIKRLAEQVLKIGTGTQPLLVGGRQARERGIQKKSSWPKGYTGRNKSRQTQLPFPVSTTGTKIKKA